MYKVCYWDEQAREQKERDATPEEAAEIEARKNAPAPIPQAVTRRQARQALLLAGLLPSVQPKIDAITDATERGLMQIWWDDSLDFERNNTALITMATALGLDSAAIDSLFVTAATL